MRWPCGGGGVKEVGGGVYGGVKEQGSCVYGVG